MTTESERRPIEDVVARMVARTAIDKRMSGFVAVGGEASTVYRPEREGGNCEAETFAWCKPWRGGVILTIGELWDRSRPTRGNRDGRIRLPAASARTLAAGLLAAADELDRFAETADGDAP